jgi:hypothetical protein
VTVLILVCHLAALADCARDTAIDVIVLPARPVICPGALGQGLIADTALGRDLGPGEAVKIVCQRA